MKKSVTAFILFGVLIVGSIFLFNNNKSNIPLSVEQKENIPVITGDLCYRSSKKGARDLYDQSFLLLTLSDESTLTGEFRSLPAEKDSKMGAFIGTAGPVDTTTMTRTVNVLWNVQSEGKNVIEELGILFGEGSAQVYFGEMVDSGDGVYRYADSQKRTLGTIMPRVDCAVLTEIVTVERYIREHIKTIVTTKPVLGGSWYLVSLSVDEKNNTSEIVYEDGHIQQKARVTYTYDTEMDMVNIEDFKEL
jgi:hypothetical protein